MLFQNATPKKRSCIQTLHLHHFLFPGYLQYKLTVNVQDFNNHFSELCQIQNFQIRILPLTIKNKSFCQTIYITVFFSRIYMY